MNVIDQLPGQIEWRVYSGDDATITLIVLEDDNTPVDLSQWIFVGQIKRDESQADPEFELDIHATDVGIVNISVHDTSELRNSMVFDVQGTNANNVTKTLVRGVIIKDQDVSR